MAEIKITIENEDFKNHWDKFVLDNHLGTFFHLYDWLKLTEWKTGFRFKPLVIRSGGSVCGIVPVFVKKLYGVIVCMSPPPRISTQWMGPLLTKTSNKQYTIEKLHQKLIETIHNFLIDKLNPDFVRFACVAGLDDIRPFKWLGYECRTGYTYFLDITNKERVFKGFDGRIRTGIRKTLNSGLNYKHVDNSHISLVIDAVSGRYKQQGLSFPLDHEFIKRLISSEAGKFIETNCVFDNKVFVTGNIMIKFKKQVHHWIGGVQPYENHTGVNEFLHWSGIERYSDEAMSHYEFMGANTKHLCDHKSKYNPDLRVFHICEWNNTRGKLVNWARRFFGKRPHG